MDVAESALAALCDQRTLLMPGQVCDHLAGIGVGDHCPHRHRQHDIRRALAVAIRAVSPLTVFGTVNARKAVLDQRVYVAVSHSVDAAASTTVPAVRTPFRDVFLAPKRRHAIAALAGMDFDQRFVDEFHRLRNKEALSDDRASGQDDHAPQAAGTIVAVLFLRGPLITNFT